MQGADRTPGVVRLGEYIESHGGEVGAPKRRSVTVLASHVGDGDLSIGVRSRKWWIDHGDSSVYTATAVLVVA
jgi:hypothetical protein